MEKAREKTGRRSSSRLFGLWERKDDKTHGFSKGMKRRLTLAMGLINDPRLLFLDEPTSGLDVQSNLIIRDVIRDLTAKGVTVFLTTHNIEEANLTCDRVAIINHGKIAAIDSPERLKRPSRASSRSRSRSTCSAGACGRARRASRRSARCGRRGTSSGSSPKIPRRSSRRLSAYAEREHLRVICINTYGPSLEDVFIKLDRPRYRTTGGEPLT